MKLKLIDIKTDTREEMVGSCDFCMGLSTISEPVFVFEKEDGEQVHIDAYDWDWGHYDEPYELSVATDNVIEFADWVSKIDFKDDLDLNFHFVDHLITDYYYKDEDWNQEKSDYEKDSEVEVKPRRYSEDWTEEDDELLDEELSRVDIDDDEFQVGMV